MKKNVVIAAFAASALGCASSTSPEESLESSQPLATESARPSEEGGVEKEGEQSDRQAIVTSWNLSDGLIQRKPGQPIGLTVKNTTEESIDVTVDLQLDGLTNTREQVLGTLLLAPLQSTILKWDPSAAPIRPVGTSAQAHVRVRYSIGDAQIRATVASLSYATSNDGAVMYLSPNDDNAVRLASKGREASHATLTAADREILLQELGSRHGWLDGARIDLDPSDITSRTVAPGVVARGNSMPLPTNDTISLPGSPVAAEQLTQEEGQPSEATTETELAPQDIPIIPVCQFSPIVYARVGKVCMYYRPDFLDSYVTSSVVSPDFDPYNSQASYANARIYASGATTDIWSGRLDADGCTPEVTYCASSMRAELQLNSIRVPNRTSGGALKDPLVC